MAVRQIQSERFNRQFMMEDLNLSRVPGAAYLQMWESFI